MPLPLSGPPLTMLDPAGPSRLTSSPPSMSPMQSSARSALESSISNNSSTLPEALRSFESTLQGWAPLPSRAPATLGLSTTNPQDEPVWYPPSMLSEVSLRALAPSPSAYRPPLPNQFQPPSPLDTRWLSTPSGLPQNTCSDQHSISRMASPSSSSTAPPFEYWAPTLNPDAVQPSSAMSAPPGSSQFYHSHHQQHQHRNSRGLDQHRGTM